MKTYMAKPEEAAAKRKWYVVDVSDRPLGRAASEIAKLLIGKHKPTYTPHIDGGDAVVVINAGQVALTGRHEDRPYYRHSGYPGGLRTTTAGKLRQERPEELIRLAVKRMLPRTVLGRQAMRRLKIYAGAEHKHTAQKPKARAI